MSELSADERTAELAANLARVRGDLDAAVAAAGRPAGSVELLVVTKFFPGEDVARLIGLGEGAFGESREPEASRKIAGLGALAEGVVFDMIGSVQTKKAKTVARWARAVHSVDRDKLVDALALGAAGALDEHDRTDPLEVFLQVSLDGDPSRGGVIAEELAALAVHVENAESLRLSGLMAITPLSGDPEQWMDRLAHIRESFGREHPAADRLSAGMSGDMALAVKYGSTCVRVGTAIMGQRPILSH